MAKACPCQKETQCPAQALPSSSSSVPHWSDLSFCLLFGSPRPQTLSSERGPGIESKPLGRETEAQKGRGTRLRTLAQNPTVLVLNPDTGLTGSCPTSEAAQNEG